MPIFPQQVADKLAEAAMHEANRLCDAAKAGGLEPGDRFALVQLWGVASAAAGAEWSRLSKLDPEGFTDEQLKRMLDVGEVPRAKTKRAVGS